MPVVAEKEALLRVFVTATRTTTETLPLATATFHVDDEETYSVEIDGTSEPIPTEINEGSLDKSLNVSIPDSVIEEGLSVVIEIDPDSTIDAEILTAERIPESGELDLGVEGVPDLELTAIPFLYTADPDSSVIEDVEGMADDEEDHELLHDTYDLLPIEEMTVDDHDPSRDRQQERVRCAVPHYGDPGRRERVRLLDGPDAVVLGCGGRCLCFRHLLRVAHECQRDSARAGAQPEPPARSMWQARQVSFDMDEPADAEEGTGIFVFLLPAEPGWEALASLVLADPGDALFTLDGDTEATMALIRDLRSGQVRAIRGDFAERPPAPPGHVVRWSRGVPDRDAWRVMTGGGTSPGP